MNSSPLLPKAPLSSIHLQKHHGYAVNYSPFFADHLAVASATNFGIIGNGRLHILDSSPHQLLAVNHFDSQDGMFDVAWSEIHQAQLVTGCGDGSLKLWDINLTDYPIANWNEHQKDVFSVHWNQVSKDIFASASWDMSIKIWSPTEKHSLFTLLGHTGCIYSAIWSPQSSNLILSGSADQSICIWDIRSSPTPMVHVPHVHTHDILTVDWDKYNETLIYTGSADHCIKVWDSRFFNSPVHVINGHNFPVRKLKSCPHVSGRIASVAYDMSIQVWDSVNTRPSQIWRSDVHSEFVFGLDWSLFVPNRFATTGWDGFVHVHQLPID